ncbi:GNAT family N-acetyltransferase [Paenibacillus allorhizosphaerae]|uniref:N-acetyltransferase domain-containing protein n=1 Tax=Paenibacillus allorhizosphaerae TaxID=2849866 RepID=A0ABM8VMN1_9BACL|nr:GNAT family N-acetyltransferase [Paenibacillus allorhizosphaerae]CAG7649961.1 hypothetical protein PAECIP111802_04601 [Paenibacillus allorhizosphaerae]
MLIELLGRIEEEPVLELLSCAVFPDPEAIARTVQLYKTDEAMELLGLEKDGALLGIAGFQTDPNNRLRLQHIAVHPEYRGQGYGRGLLLELIALKQPAAIVAETDEEAVDFYRNVGFVVTSLGEKYPGVERFHCIYEAEPAQEADDL